MHVLACMHALRHCALHALTLTGRPWSLQLFWVLPQHGSEDALHRSSKQVSWLGVHRLSWAQSPGEAWLRQRLTLLATQE